MRPAHHQSARDAEAVHPPVQRLPGQAEFGGGLREDAVVVGQRALDPARSGSSAAGAGAPARVAD